MIIDDKGRLFGKVSIIDIAVLVIIVLSVAGGAYVYNKIVQKQIAPSDKSVVRHEDLLADLEVELVLQNVRNVTYNAIRPGDDIYSVETGKYFGEVLRAESKPHQEVISSLNGTSKLADLPGKLDVTIYAKLTGQKTGNGYFTGENIHLAYGEAFPIKTTSIQATPTIENITIIPGTFKNGTVTKPETELIPYKSNDDSESKTSSP